MNNEVRLELVKWKTKSFIILWSDYTWEEFSIPGDRGTCYIQLKSGNEIDKREHMNLPYLARRKKTLTKELIYEYIEKKFNEIEES